MNLVVLIVGPIVGGLLAWLFGKVGKAWTRIWPLLFLLLDLVLLLVIWFSGNPNALTLGGSGFYAETLLPWIPAFGIQVHLALDGLSLALSLLTVFLGILVILASWRRQREHPPFYYFNLSLVLAGILGTFLAVDLFLFFLFWELMLVPTYFLITAWGGDGTLEGDRRRAAAGFKFFVFTQLSGLLMLVSILALYFLHGAATGSYTFDLFELIGTPLSSGASFAIMLGFLAAFAVKLPVVPFHSWLPDAYTEAPLEATIILAGLMSKTGAYGFLRFVFPLFQNAASQIRLVMLILGVIGIVYGAVLAFGQRDLKRLVAYTSVSHLGFVLVGIFSMNQIAMEGAVLLMISHGLATSGLFLVVDLIERRTGTRDLRRLGGLFSVVPKLGGAGMVFGLIALGVPGSGNFLSEVLVIIGTFRVSIPIAIIAATGMIFSVIYALWIIQRALHGPQPGESVAEGSHGAAGVHDAGGSLSGAAGGHGGAGHGAAGVPARAAQILAGMHDLSFIEGAVSIIMILAVFWLGIYPQPLLQLVAALLQHIHGGIA